LALSSKDGKIPGLGPQRNLRADASVKKGTPPQESYFVTKDERRDLESPGGRLGKVLGKVLGNAAAVSAMLDRLLASWHTVLCALWVQSSCPKRFTPLRNRELFHNCSPGRDHAFAGNPLTCRSLAHGMIAHGVSLLH
jgi:hypothetical protein